MGADAKWPGGESRCQNIFPSADKIYFYLAAKIFLFRKIHEFSSVTQKEKTPCYPTKPIRSNTNNYTFSSRKRLSIFLVEYCMCNIYSQSRNSTIIICMIYIRMSLLLSLFFPCFNLSDIYMNSPKEDVNDNQKRDGFSFLFSLSWFLN